jgi:ferric-dicitrate binding protein FerR (iron transport regulator)
MTQRNEDIESAIQAMKNDQPTKDEVQKASARVWQKLAAASEPELQPVMIHGCEDVVKLLPAYSTGKLSAERRLVVKNHLRECVSCRNQAEGRTNVVSWVRTPDARRAASWRGFAAVAAAIVVAVLGLTINNAYFVVPAGARASVQTVDGIVYRVTPEGERVAVVGDQLNEADVLRTTSGGHAFLKMTDGSIIEANERTELSLAARGKNATLELTRGAVIVKAAKRDAGHLYVKTPDCRVAVTGTVFAVGAGVKGSRVSVLEGAVRVAYGANDDVLHSGEQVSTSANMEYVPVSEDIAWSRDLPKHLELLSQFARLQKRLDQVQMPGPRFNSTLIGRVPSDAVFYASLPNAGQALEEANRILQDQIQQSDALRQWFAHGKSDTNDLNEAVAKIRQLSDYLGEEVVAVGFSGKRSGVAMVAEVARPGLQDFLQNQFAKLSSDGGLVVVDEAGLTSLPATNKKMIALVRHDVAVFASDRDVLARVNAQLNSGTAGLQSTEFGQRLMDSYSRGAGFLLAADLGRLIASGESHKAQRTARHLDQSGLQDMRYLVVEHREINGVPDNHMVVDFAGTRRGVASWLAAPAPMGSLQFVSRNASLAMAFIAKEPALVLDDIFSMTQGDAAKQKAELADAESKLKVSIRQDLAAQFGGDAVLALDGPVLPTPSWKLVVEVHDANALAASLQKFATGVNEEAQRHGRPGVELRSEDVNGQRYYALIPREVKATAVYYTFASGYMIVGPNRAMLMNALRTRMTGDSLANSGDFKALLPKDQHANYSMIAYQNLSPILQPLLSQLNGEQAKLVQELAADSRPSVICAWGHENSIEAATNSRLLGLDWLTAASLISGGTSKHKHP